MTGQPSPLAAAALRLARAGYRVFPCIEEGKRPLTRHGLNDASGEERLVAAWWQRWPGANIGLRTGWWAEGPDVDVLDIDIHGPADGFATVRRLQAAGLVPEPMARVRTGSGGEHWYYPAMPDQRSWSEAAHGIDVRAAGGYVIAPPSVVRQAGGQRGGYRVIERNQSTRMLDSAAIRAELRPPDALIRFRVPASQDAAPDRLVQWMGRRVEGERNASLFWATCRLVTAGANPRAIDSLRAAALSVGLNRTEVDATIASAYRRVAADHAPVPSAPEVATGRSLGR